LTPAAAKAGRLSGSSGGSSGLPFLFNDQSVYYLMLSVEDDVRIDDASSDGVSKSDDVSIGNHGVTLDYRSALFLSMYGTPNRLKLEVTSDLF